MSINFHSNEHKYSYTTRNVDAEWKKTVSGILGEKMVKTAVDVGCGGGIYCKALSDIGVKKTIGIDFSKSNLEGAKETCQPDDTISFRFGTAKNTTLPISSCELVLQRALIHHLDQLNPAFAEAHRILKQDGYLIIQDRTPEDCFVKGSHQHIRGYFFDCFPRLKQLESKRRFTSKDIHKSFSESGFTVISELKIWETRKVYEEKQALLEDIKKRKGRSILHELSDMELAQLMDYIDESLPNMDKIIEKDRWTLYVARK
ncbi:class I SAM-dependent methyltransferase [Alkalihalobacillus trypoxylicola]|uniref:Methyltransferase type 11 n=1 Tax=Alkalihalobacillus trypoxylicola TaxID=519424 RepID=A0A162DGF6_9BACI|nr:class I SAM-dependent methyltransferase [Alkalihalobacillus trypoxylicola]KYG29546.1 methyltransferase type 11 [Alkalihalobacillus trypoxylicola]